MKNGGGMTPLPPRSYGGAAPVTVTYDLSTTMTLADSWIRVSIFTNILINIFQTVAVPLDLSRAGY